MNEYTEQIRRIGEHNDVDSRSNLPVPLHTFSFCEILFYGYLLNRLKSLETVIQANQTAVANLNKVIVQLQDGFKQCVEIAIACQKQTAELLNNNIERYVLNPVIETVVFLCDEINKLKSVADGKAENISDELEISLQLAQDKLAHLDIERITASAVDCFDSARHAVCGYEETSDNNLHGKINKIVTMGIFYRGKVLTPARVKIYRYCENKKLETTN